MRRLRLTAFGLLVLAAAAGGRALLVGGDRHHAVARTAVAHPAWVSVSTLLARKCLACHQDDAPRLDFTDHAAVLAYVTCGEEPLVVPGDPAASALIDHVQWRDHDDPRAVAVCAGVGPRAGIGADGWYDEPTMPPEPAEWLTPTQLHEVTRWIELGCPEYTLGCGESLTELDFPSARTCEGCHPKQYEEWSRSMHAYAMRSPVFDAFVRTVAARTSGTIGTFCTRCHTAVGVALGEDGMTRLEDRSPLSQEGVSCVVCHRRGHAQGRVSGAVAVEPGGLMDGCMYGPFDDAGGDPEGRHAAAGSGHIRTSGFCGGCHDVTNAAGLRLEEAFSEWRNSPAARNGVTCQQCHMGPEPGVPTHPSQRPLGYAADLPGTGTEGLKLRPLSSHSFTGPDYSMLPADQFPHRLDWLRDHAGGELTEYQRDTRDELVTRNVEALGKSRSERVRLLKNAAKLTVHPPTAHGRKVKLRVDVTSLFAGHNFPTGFSEERQAWVELFVRDDAGRVVFASGDFDEHGDLRDRHSHDVLAGHAPLDRQLLNFQSQFLVAADRGTERAVTIPVNGDLRRVNLLRPSTHAAGAFGRPGDVRVQKSSIPPLGTRGRTYVFKAPAGCGVLHWHARLLFRNLPPHLLDAIGTPHLKPALQVVEIDSQAGSLRLGGRR